MSNWYDFIFIGIGAVLKFFSDLAGGNFLVGLIVFAVLIKLILIPFGIKQQSNSIKQSRYKPREMAIRRKYAGRNDKATQQKMNNEIMEMYQKDGASPMGGCLPMLLQMAIILLLYQVIIHPLLYVVGVSQESVTAMTEYFKASVESGGLDISLGGGYQEITIMKEALARGQEAFAGGFKTFCETYVADGVQPYLAGADTLVSEAGKMFTTTINFNIFGLRNFLAETPSVASLWTFPWTNLVWLVLIPLLNFGAQFFTMKLQKKLTFQPMQEMQQAGCMGKGMEWGFPAMTLVIAFRVPAAIGIYWLFNNVLGIIQMLILNKAMPIPKFTEEDIKAAEKELKGKSEKLPKTPEGVRSNPNSLHTIDFEEEDYAVLPEYESVYDKTEEEKTEAQAEAKAKINGQEADASKSKIGAAPLKKDKSKKEKK